MLLSSGSTSLYISVPWRCLLPLTSTYNLIPCQINSTTVRLSSWDYILWFGYCFFLWLNWVSVLLIIMKVHLTATLCNYYSSIFGTFTWFYTCWSMSSRNKIICLCLGIVDALLLPNQHLLWIINKLRKSDFLISWIIAISIWIIVDVYLYSRNSIYCIHSLHILSKLNLIL